jgi:hypothetical protein
VNLDFEADAETPIDRPKVRKRDDIKIMQVELDTMSSFEWTRQPITRMLFHLQEEDGR